MPYCIIVNENTYDASAWIEAHDTAGLPTVGPWERVYSCHDTREAAESALPDAKKYAADHCLSR